jgi:hypothetical protein
MKKNIFISFLFLLPFLLSFLFCSFACLFIAFLLSYLLYFFLPFSNFLFLSFFLTLFVSPLDYFLFFLSFTPSWFLSFYLPLISFFLSTLCPPFRRPNRKKIATSSPRYKRLHKAAYNYSTSQEFHIFYAAPYFVVISSNAGHCSLS